MIQCQVCGARATNALCRKHSDELRANLEALTGEHGWLSNLADSATGNTRMGGGDNVRHNPGEEHAPIRVNFKASDLAAQVQGTLARWVQDLCESRGVEYRPVRFVRTDFVGPLALGTLRGLQYVEGGAHLALWLLVHCDAIVVSEDAGLCYNEIESVITAIKLAIDRPPDLRDVGECPTPVTDVKRCGNYLRAERDVDLVKCDVCHATHSVEKVVEMSLARGRHMPWSAEAIWAIVEEYGLPLKARTWRDWRATGVVKPCLYQRPNGRIGIGRQNVDDVPLYRLSDVQDAIAAKGKPDRRKVGAK